MTLAEHCILRSPPFPGVSPTVSAVSHPAVDTVTALNAAAERPLTAGNRLRALVIAEKMAIARVGGPFWQPTLDNKHSGHLLFCPSSLTEAEEMAAMGARGETSETVVILPATPWRSKARKLFERAGSCAVYDELLDPWSCLDGASALHAGGDDERTVLALAAGLPVHLWSNGRYAGWGVTHDASSIASRAQLDRPAFLGAILIGASRYRDCFEDCAANAEHAVEQLAFWREQLDRNRQIGAVCGIAGWKRQEMRSFLWKGASEPVRFSRNSDGAVRRAAVDGKAVAVWPSRVPQSSLDLAETLKVPLYQIEDGFVRSAGLGSGLHPPLSVVVDHEGIYYDPSRPSSLETLFETADFSQSLLDRAQALIKLIVSKGISKYSTGRDVFHDLPPGRRTVLVTGQVEDDRSVRLGGGNVTGNLDLLKRARQSEPDSYIIFKPHPDVEAGHRKGRVVDSDAAQHADAIVRDVPMSALLDAVDAVHVWTSLAGFEALLRGRDVTVHGAPFFAGWGLTTDLGPLPDRRTRRLTLAELVAGSLILYPRYLDPITRMPCPPEILIDRLSRPGAAGRSWLTELRKLQGLLRLKWRDFAA